MSTRSVAGRRGRAIGVVAASLLMAACGSRTQDQTAAPTTTAASLATKADEALQGLVSAVRDGLSAAPAAVVPNQPAEVAAVAAPAATRPRVTRRPAKPIVAEAAPLPASRVMATAAAVEPSIQEGPAPLPFDDTIYTQADMDVQPPRGQKLALPIALISQVPRETTTIELMVSEAGAVERARLVSKATNLPEMMILSSAKMWTFVPAIKDGQPVRYRLILPLSHR